MPAFAAANGSSAETHATHSDPSSSSSSGGRSISPESSLPDSPEGSSPSSAVKAEDLLELGSFGAPHGVRGDIRLFPTTDSAKERLTEPGLRCLLMPMHTQSAGIFSQSIPSICLASPNRASQALLCMSSVAFSVFLCCCSSRCLLENAMGMPQGIVLGAASSEATDDAKKTALAIRWP